MYLYKLYLFLSFLDVNKKQQINPIKGIKTGMPNLLLSSIFVSLILLSLSLQLCLVSIFSSRQFIRKTVEVSCIFVSDIVLVDIPDKFTSVFLNLIILTESELSPSIFCILPSIKTNFFSSLVT